MAGKSWSDSDTQTGSRGWNRPSSVDLSDKDGQSSRKGDFKLSMLGFVLMVVGAFTSITASQEYITEASMSVAGMAGAGSLGLACLTFGFGFLNSRKWALKGFVLMGPFVIGNAVVAVIYGNTGLGGMYEWAIWLNYVVIPVVWAYLYVSYEVFEG